jgi:hypothetical protein
MATQRRPPNPSGVQEVDPMVDTGPTEGLSTMAEMFGNPMVVDEVQQIPYAYANPLGDAIWVIRPNIEIEDMTVGSPDNHFSFKPGTRYRVPQRVAEILYNRDMLMEMPYPYEPQRR